MDWRVVTVSALLAGLMVSAGFVTYDNIIESEPESIIDGENQGESVDDNPPTLIIWNLSKSWDGEYAIIAGMVIDESLSTVSLSMKIFDESGVQQSLSSAIDIQQNGVFTKTLSISDPGSWRIEAEAVDEAGASSGIHNSTVEIIAPTETDVSLTFLWTPPEEGTDIGVLTGHLSHEFFETCAIRYHPDGQTSVATSVNQSNGRFTFFIDVDLESLAGSIEASCGLFSLSSTTISVNLTSDESESDSDGDGINDDIDSCDATPSGEPVHSDGCSDSERDSDGDGKDDASDLCPGTLEGAAVDDDGCADAEKDSDSDGTSDADDQCPNTPSFEAVDIVGCSDSQKDSDGDGVSDDVDQCPSTPQGTTVLATGCPPPDWLPQDSIICLDNNGSWVQDFNEQYYGSGKSNDNGASSQGASDDNAGNWFQCKVIVTTTDTMMTIESNGIPNHDFLSTLGCCADEMDYTAKITLNPVNDTSGGHSSSDCPAATGRWECAPSRGAVAIAVNGVPMYGPEEGPGGDAVALHFSYFDENRQPIELGWCTGHSAGANGFHYHYDAQCIHWVPGAGEEMSDYDISKLVSDEHSPIIGWAFDGFPIYGMFGFDSDGSTIKAITSSYTISESDSHGPGYNGISDWSYSQGVGDLDECNGRFGPTPEYPDGIYHYMATPLSGSALMVEDTNGDDVAMIGFPYFLLCYHGVADVDGQEMGGGQGPPPQGMSSAMMSGFDGPRPIVDKLQEFASLFSHSIMILIILGTALIQQRNNNDQQNG